MMDNNMNPFKNQWASSAGLAFMLTGGLAVSTMSKNMFMVWLGLEMKMFGVMPYLNSKGEKSNNTMFLSNGEMNVSFFYFFVQVMGSLFFAWGAIMGKWYMISMMGLMMKMGLVPFFWWVPPLMSRLDWVCMGLLSTLQKVPGMILFRLVFDLNLMMCVYLSLLGFLIASIGMKFSYKKMKGLMAWSSMSNMSMLFLTMVLSNYVGMSYYCLYSVMVLTFCTALQLSDSSCVSKSFLSGNTINSVRVTKFLLLVFSGLPPLMSFLMKMYFMSGMYLPDMSLVMSDMEFKKSTISFFYLLGSFLNSWNMVLSFTALIILQSVGYIKAFMNMKASSTYRFSLASLMVKKYDWLFYSLFILMYTSSLVVIWLC